MASLSSWENEMMLIVSKLFARKDSELFRDPVPYEELGLTGAVLYLFRMHFHILIHSLSF